MTLRFSCECGQKLKCPDDRLGRSARCPKCSNWVLVPNSASYDTIAERVESKTDSVSEAEGSLSASNRRVVVADSVEEDRFRLIAMLREHGYDVFDAANGPEAVEVIRRIQPHCAVLDVKLDMMSGFKVIDQIRNLANPKNDVVWNVPVIMTTSKLRGRDKQYSMSLGAKGYFVKPLTPAQICPRLEKEVVRYAGR